jgi:hypothetical protein
MALVDEIMPPVEAALAEAFGRFEPPVERIVTEVVGSVIKDLAKFLVDAIEAIFPGVDDIAGYALDAFGDLFEVLEEAGEVLAATALAVIEPVVTLGETPQQLAQTVSAALVEALEGLVGAMGGVVETCKRAVRIAGGATESAGPVMAASAAGATGEARGSLVRAVGKALESLEDLPGSLLRELQRGAHAALDLFRAAAPDKVAAAESQAAAAAEAGSRAALKAAGASARGAAGADLDGGVQSVTAEARLLRAAAASSLEAARRHVVSVAAGAERAVARAKADVGREKDRVVAAVRAGTAEGRKALDAAKGVPRFLDLLGAYWVAFIIASGVLLCTLAYRDMRGGVRPK